jgi:hypothetical protein
MMSMPLDAAAAAASTWKLLAMVSLLLLLLVLVPIGWIKIDRNRRKDHGIELISFDLSFASYLGDGASLAFSGFVCSSSLLCEIRVYRRFRGSCKDGEIIKVDRRITSTTNPAGYELSSLHAAGLE